MTGEPMRVGVWRGRLLESEHRVHAVLCTPEGRVVYAAGEEGRTVYFRSAAKPLQAMAAVAAGAVASRGVTEAELAVMCGSHAGERVHVDTVLSLLSRAGLGPEHLRCGVHPPLDPEAWAELVRQGRQPGPEHHNCSGKHAGMLILARHLGADLDRYLERTHPVQVRVEEAVATVTGLPHPMVEWGVDGCGAPAPAVPLWAMARAYARLVRPETLAPPWGEAARLVARAMRRHPVLVGGREGRLCTAVMRATGGRLLAKGGAEAVFCVGLPEARLGLALKVEDGTPRAVGPAVVELLSRFRALSAEEEKALAEWRRPAVRTHAGEAVGEVRVLAPRDDAPGPPREA